MFVELLQCEDLFSNKNIYFVQVIRDKDTQMTKGFGFVTMMKKADGERAIEELDGKELKGRNLNVRPSDN